jgi:citrate synthase
MSKIDSTRLKQLLTYDEEYGSFYWRVDRGHTTKAGDVAGCLHHNGYVVITIEKKQYQAHRLVWLYVHGKYPDAQIDHINNIKSDNRITNLRQATQAENCQNIKKSRGASGYLGVSIDSARGNRWKSSIRVNGKTHHLGWFKTPEQAHEAYLLAKRAMHPFGTL